MENQLTITIPIDEYRMLLENHIRSIEAYRAIDNLTRKLDMMENSIHEHIKELRK